jgi:hypothetical protein
MSRFETACVLLGLAIASAGCSTLGRSHDALSPGDEYLIVDCLLPPRLVPDASLGVHLLPRTPEKITALECNKRGGAFTLPDAPDHRKWSLDVWMPSAERGDPAAQYYLGEIYERGLGDPPDFARAAEWYRRAAEQGDRRAAANLARLHERGLGVPEDRAEALRWYQVAAGADDPRTHLEQARTLLLQLERLQEELQQQIHELRGLPRPAPESWLRDPLHGAFFRDGRPGASSGARAPPSSPLSVLAGEGPAHQAQRSLELALAENARHQREISELKRRIAELEQRLPPGDRSPSLRVPTPEDFGSYYALVIGNRDYLHWRPLDTSVNDATKIAETLTDHYGFERTRSLINSTRAEVLRELEELKQDINRRVEREGAVINLLLFYAGHGALAINGYWIPVDGSRRSRVEWIMDASIAEHLQEMKARQILVIADSCYAATLGRRSVAAIVEERPLTRDSLSRNRPRRVMTSGGLHPVFERPGAPHSIFAEILLDELGRNAEVVAGTALFERIRARVETRAAGLGVEQSPTYAPIAFAGDEMGDFYLVPKRN